LELRVSSFLTDNSYYVAHSLYYIDEDEEKSREVDIRALKNYEIKKIGDVDVRAFIRNCFLIECKKSDKPWIFLCSPKNSYDLDYVNIKSIPKREFIDEISIDILKKKHPFANFSVVGRSYSELSKQTGENIFKAITTVVKSTSYFMEKKFASDETSICYYYPLIILEGKLFEGTLENNEIKVKEVNSILLSFSYTSKKGKSFNFLILVINEYEIPNFLKKFDEVLVF